MPTIKYLPVDTVAMAIVFNGANRLIKYVFYMQTKAIISASSSNIHTSVVKNLTLSHYHGLSPVVNGRKIFISRMLIWETN